MRMDAEVISIGNRRRDAVAEPAGVPPTAMQIDMERVRRALSNTLEILKPLGSDRAIERYLARDQRGKSVQLDVLSARAAGDVRTRKLFYREALSASKLAHMNILATTSAEEVHGVDFRIVEHGPNARTLRDLLDHNGWLNLKDAAQIADQIASALDHAHEVGVLHLRLQPECVLVAPDGWVMVADFGVDVNLDTERLKGPNPRYASPELTMRKMVDHRSDFYSLGAVMYEMLTDRTLFDSNDGDYVRRKQMSVTPAPPHLISRDVPEQVSNLVMKLLDREPVNRFASATAFQAALDNAVNQM